MFFLISSNRVVAEGSPRRDGESCLFFFGPSLAPVSLDGERREDCSEFKPLTTPEKASLSLPVEDFAMVGLASVTFCIVSKGKSFIEITPFLKRLSSYHILLQIVCQEGVFSNCAVFQEVRKRLVIRKVMDGNYNR